MSSRGVSFSRNWTIVAPPRTAASTVATKRSRGIRCVSVMAYSPRSVVCPLIDVSSRLLKRDTMHAEHRSCGYYTHNCAEKEQGDHDPGLCYHPFLLQSVVKYVERGQRAP